MPKVAKVINDPLHGGIELSRAETAIIDLPIYQRLRRLKQLAHINYIFPGAEHSRFIHSLGVFHVMNLMTKHLQSKGYIKAFDTKILRMAALLHDIGHYPLSHLGEGAYGYFETSSNSLDVVEGFADPNPHAPKLYDLSGADKKAREAADHEKLGAYIVENHKDIKRILGQEGLDPKDVGDIIKGTHLRKYYSQLMHSSLDADRLEYLLRDSFQTGVKYGHVDLEYLIRVLELTDAEKENDRELVCMKKGQHVAEHFLMCRYFHYSQIVAHKTSQAFESVIKALIIHLIIAEKMHFNSYDDIEKGIDTDEFLDFDDIMLDNEMRSFSSTNTNPVFDRLYKCLHDRRRPKTFYEIKGLHDNDNAGNTYSKLLNYLKISPQKLSGVIGDEDFWGYNTMSINIEKKPSYASFTRDKSEYDAELQEVIKVADKKGIPEYLAGDESSIINKIAQYTNESIRLYYVEGDKEVDYDKMRKGIDNLLK